jgi:hypothetical protein
MIILKRKFIYDQFSDDLFQLNEKKNKDMEDKNGFLVINDHHC